MTSKTIVRILKCVGIIATSFLVQSGATAQAHLPGRNLATIIVPYPAGSSFDIVARRIQPELGKSLARTIIVENFGGASGSLGAQRLLNADPNTLTMLIGSPNELALPPLTLQSVRYKPEDFRMVAQLSIGALAIMARPHFPANNLSELIAKAKLPDAKPLSYASTGVGSVFHLAGADFAKRLGIRTTHVPYKGGAPAIQDVMADQIDITFLPLIPSYIQAAKEGKIKVLAIMSAERHSGMSEVPSVDTVPALRGFHYSMWTGLFVSSKVPKETADVIGKAANKIVATPAYREWVGERGNSAGTVMDLEQSAQYFAAESGRFQRLARDIKIDRE
ncbi:putative Bug-like extracytoplasmic solute binding receptor, TTT family [Cupriavidus taiwanensis]|uniref:Bug family tripartite tricarboxylate transporter substrate binding protein n=1 Tax=Cupriavidus taiwanensis TaxID=164546 RepID=UPI000E148A7D|nr:tripartite tricarboxylate transporter substrate binding protein [Cupriavidus taiwanensis]SOZ99793.1 putative Bug-like extracytoplasmic solute binding receptor, TTT family [Cupriavidus taiwanensis]